MRLLRIKFEHQTALFVTVPTSASNVKKSYLALAQMHLPIALRNQSILSRFGRSLQCSLCEVTI